MNDSVYVSQVPESHYKIVDERRRKSMAGGTKGLTWEEVKRDLKGKE